MRKLIVMTGVLPAILGLGLCAVCLAAGGSSAKETKTSAGDSPTAEQQADAFYNEGLGHRDLAWELAEKLDSMPQAARAKTDKKVRSHYERAAKLYGKAIEKNPQHHQAHGALGYARRQLGDFEGALESYDAALAIKPDYGNALEYRGEAYLGLGRISDAQNAYRLLADNEPELAAELLGSMTAWIEARRAEPEGVSEARLDGLANWVADRELNASGSTRHKGRW